MKLKMTARPSHHSNSPQVAPFSVAFLGGHTREVLGKWPGPTAHWGHPWTQQRTHGQGEGGLGRSLRKRLSQEVGHRPDLIGAGKNFEVVEEINYLGGPANLVTLHEMGPDEVGRPRPAAHGSAPSHPLPLVSC